MHQNVICSAYDKDGLEEFGRLPATTWFFADISADSSSATILKSQGRLVIPFETLVAQQIHLSRSLKQAHGREGRTMIAAEAVLMHDQDGFMSINVVVANPTPLEVNAAKHAGCTDPAEHIDTAGCALILAGIRARCLVATKPDQYKRIVDAVLADSETDLSILKADLNYQASLTLSDYLQECATTILNWSL